jgi:MFS family permease
MRAGERRRLLVLGLPTFGLALAITTVSSYLPVVASNFTGSPAVVGILIGGEGLMALFVPLLVGAWSDRLSSRIGQRLPFVLVATPLIAAALLLMALAKSLLPIAIAVVVFFAAYYIAYEPYRALYPDLFGDEIAGRAQANQAVWRGAGTIVALASGGLLLSAATLLPFAVSAALLVAAVAIFMALVTASGDLRRRQRAPAGSVRAAGARLFTLVAKHDALRAYLVANALWELSLGALKTFIVLYVTSGLGYSLSASSAIIGLVAAVVLAGAIVSGKLADRFGKLRAMRFGLWPYGALLAVPIFTTSPGVLGPAAILIALGGGMIMSLPYALLMPLMPRDEHGSLTGFYSLSRGIGMMLGPLLAGIAVQSLGGVFDSTEGYGAMWIVCSGGIIASIPMLRWLRDESEDRERLKRE